MLQDVVRLLLGNIAKNNQIEQKYSFGHIFHIFFWKFNNPLNKVPDSQFGGKCNFLTRVMISAYDVVFGWL